MMKNLSKTIVTIEIDGQIKTYMNSNKNRDYLKNHLSSEEWSQIEEVWGTTPYITDEKELREDKLKEAQNKTIKRVKEICTQTITNGIDFYGEHFSFEITDQLNIARLINQVKDGRTKVIYHADGQPCRFFSAEEITNLNDAMENFIEYHTTYFNSLKEYIKTLKLQSKLSAVKYGMEIPNNNLQLLLLNQEVE